MLVLVVLKGFRTLEQLYIKFLPHGSFLSCPESWAKLSACRCQDMCWMSAWNEEGQRGNASKNLMLYFRHACSASKRKPNQEMTHLSHVFLLNQNCIGFAYIHQAAGGVLGPRPAVVPISWLWNCMCALPQKIAPLAKLRPGPDCIFHNVPKFLFGIPSFK